MIARAESVDIETGTGRHGTEHGGLRRLGTRKILWRRELDVAGLASEHAHRHAGPFGQRGVVGEIVAALFGRPAVRFKQRIESKGLWCLHQAKGTAVD